MNKRQRNVYFIPNKVMNQALNWHSWGCCGPMLCKIRIQSQAPAKNLWLRGSPKKDQKYSIRIWQVMHSEKIVTGLNRVLGFRTLVIRLPSTYKINQFYWNLKASCFSTLKHGNLFLPCSISTKYQLHWKLFFRQ